MTTNNQQELGKTLWSIANNLRGAMMADDFRDYMLSFLFWEYLSDNYIVAAKKELGADYPEPANEKDKGNTNALKIWYDANPDDTFLFEKQMRRKIHYVIEPKYLWDNVVELARTQSEELLNTLQDGFKYIENESFESSFKGLFSEINLNSEKLGKNYTERNALLSKVITTIAQGLATFSSDSDTLGDAYEYLIGQFAAGSGQKAGEFYTPQMISTILSRIVTLDCQDPKTGKKNKINRVLDFACGSGSLLLNVRHEMGNNGIGKIYGQEKNITTYNLARMNMLLHGVKDTEFEIHHGDTLLNDDNIDAVIGLPANLFYSTGIPVCIIVLKKCRKSDNILFINASGEDHYEKGKRQNNLRDTDVDKIVEAYQKRENEARYCRMVSLSEIKENDYNLNITRYVNLSKEEEQIDLKEIHKQLVEINKKIAEAQKKHNTFLKELGLDEI